MTQQHIAIPYNQIVAFCQRYHIHKLALFGSVLGDNFRPDSDIDVLAEFEPGHAPGLIRISAMEIELSELLGRKTDLRTAAELSPHFRQTILDSAEAIYGS